MSYWRILHRTGVLLALTGLALAVLAAPRAADAAPGYEGIWSVVIMTQQGICDSSYRYPVRIVKGSVVSAGASNVNISGTVHKNGAVTVHVGSGDKTATGTGRLAGARGGGNWSGGNGACSGVWQAERRS
jgi:hypothetical protein